MKTHIATGMILTLALTFTANPLQADTGKALFEEDCTKCHNTEVFTKDDRSVKSLEGLKSRVKQCTVAAESNWTDDEIKIVVDYLNKDFYKF